MESKKIWIIAGLVGAIIAGFIVWGVLSPSTAPKSGSTADRIVPNSDITYYFGAECPHCMDVKKAIEEKGLRDLVLFSEKEVWNNSKNAMEMEGKAKECGIDKSKMGVPFLVSRGKCFIGAPDVIKELEGQVEFEENA